MAPAAPRAAQPAVHQPAVHQPESGQPGTAAAGSPLAGQPLAGGQASLAGAWRRWRVPLSLVAAILLGGTAIALLQPAAPVGYLDPGNARPGGARALADILASHGHVIVRATTPAAAVGVVRAGGATLLVTSPGLLTGRQLAGLARAHADFVLVAPDRAELAALAPAVTIDGHVPARARRPACGLTAARLAGRASMGGVLLRTAPADAAVCYPADGLPSLVRYQAGGRAITVLGTGAPLANSGLAALGNSALALNLLSARPRIVWLVPAARPGAAAPGRRQPLTSLIPLPADLVAIQLAIAALLAALWRARRLGPLVPEPLPIVIRAAETTEGHARLYQARRARGQAAAALRAATVRRIAPGLGLTPADAPAAVVAALAERTGTGAAQIEALLFGADPADDAALVGLASDLDVLEREVRAR